MRSARALVLFGLWVLPIAILFKLVPMPWWARYTLWLYALGLPALAFTLTTIASLPNRALSRGLQGAFTLLVCMAFFEYGYSAKWSVTRDHFLGPAHVASLGDLWKGITTTNENGLRVEWHEAEGISRDVMSGDAIVAFTSPSPGNEIMHGRLAMPIGQRRLITVDENIGKDQAAADAFIAKYLPRYIVWDHEAHGEPPVLLRTATRWEWLGTLMIFEFGNDPNPPRLLYPE